MTRRKVTMLEAFQASAKESAERAAAERRRLIAEREKEIRRQESGRPPEDRGDIAAVFPGRSVHDAPAMAPVDVSPPATGDLGDGGPAPAPEAALPVDQIAPLDAAATSLEVPAPEARRPESPDASPADGPAVPSTDESERGLDPDPTALDEEVFALPMTGRGFVAILALLLAGVFIIGWTVGRRSSASAAPPGAEGGGDTGLAGAGFSGEGLDPIDFGLPQGAPVADDRNGDRDQGVAPPSPEAGIAEGPAAADPVAPVDPDTEADLAFWDPAMSYTVLAITYSRSEANVELAWDAYDVLLAGGLPVVKPVERDGRIFVFVGAAEATAQLADLRDRVASFRSGPGGSYEYRSAYVVNLSQYR